MSDAPHVEAPPHGGGAAGFIRRRLGGMPVWVWVLIFAAMLALGFYWKRHREASALSGNPVTGDTTVTGDNLGTEGQDGYVSNGGTSSVGTGDGNSGSDTNAEWAQQAANALQQQGQDPTAVQTALSKYLSGQNLTAAEQQIVNTALYNNGTPPQGVVAVSTATPSTSYVAQYGDTITSVAQKFYGDPAKWKEIYAANVKVLKNNPLGLHHGMTLILPGDGLKDSPGAGAVRTVIPANHHYTAQYGDNTYQISQKFYGSNLYADKIKQMNPRKFDGINANPGAIIVLP